MPDEAVTGEAVQAPAAASAQVQDSGKAPEPAPKRSFFASLFGRRQVTPEPETQAEPKPEAEAAQISTKAEQVPAPAEAPVAEQAETAAQTPAGQAAPVQDEAVPAPEQVASSGSGASAGGGWALFEAAPAPEQEPVYAQAPQAPQPVAPVQEKHAPVASDANAELTVRLRQAEPKLSAWLDVVLDGVSEAGPLLESRIRFLLESLEAPAPEIDAFVADFSGWLARMEYRELDEFRSELQYRLAIALDLEDEEDERSRLFVKLTASLAKTRAEFAKRLEGLFASHGELDDDFWEEMEELFIMADLGYEAAVGLVERLKERCREEGITSSEGVREALKREIKQIFAQPRRILKINPPEIVLMIGVNGAGKTTTIAKLAYRDRMQGKKVMIAAADTFRAAAIDQMRVWAERVGTLFHAKQPGADPASVAFEAVDRALKEGVDVLYVDTAGRLQTKVNLMDELSKIRQVITKKHPGAPHRTVLVLDATTGQNALSQAKLFKESAGVDELILTKLDGTAKGGVAIAVALQQGLPITYVGLGEKVEDLRPFNGDDYADALLASV
ncbi:MAG: signal recognition particle-docking protein FtsY [Desulfovibrio sp.]|nr:signal recognition particle-docking protein FtsY [Desulfovibrio sp.]